MGDRLGIAGAAGLFFFLYLYELYDFLKIIFILDNTHTNLLFYILLMFNLFDNVTVMLTLCSCA